MKDLGNTAQKCGLLPSELWKQKEELLAVLKMVCSNNMQFGFDSSKRRILRLEKEEWDLMEQAIKNADHE